MKSVRFERLLAATAFGLILALSSHAGMAQQSEQMIEAAIPAPDTSPALSVSTKDAAAAPTSADTGNDSAAPANSDALKTESSRIPPRQLRNRPT